MLFTFKRLKTYFVLTGLWLAIALVLGSHFRFYYHADWSDAMEWSISNAFLWVVIFVGLNAAYAKFLRKMRPRRAAACFIPLAVISGVLLHPILVVILSELEGTNTRPFVDDVMHLTAKRYPQGILAGLLIAGVAFGASRNNFKQLDGARDSSIKDRSTGQWLWIGGAKGGHRIATSAIIYAEAAGNYVSIATAGGAHLERMTMKALGEKLGPRFFRISRKHFVSLDHVNSVKTAKSRSAAVILADGSALPVSRSRKAALVKAIAGNG